jgi:hypothetical protein
MAASLSAKRSTGSNPVRPATMGSSFNGRIPGLHPGDEGSIPSGSTIRGCRPMAQDSELSTRRCGFDSRQPRQIVSTVAEGRDGDLGGLISLAMPVRFRPPLPTAGSFNGRTAVLQTAHGGSIPSPATTLVPFFSSSAVRREGPPSRVTVV